MVLSSFLDTVYSAVANYWIYYLAEQPLILVCVMQVIKALTKYDSEGI